MFKTNFNPICRTKTQIHLALIKVSILYPCANEILGNKHTIQYKQYLENYED